MDDRGDDPEDYGRAGYLFNALARAGFSFRDYGGLLHLSGYDATGYHLNVPALAALNGNVDLDYASSTPKMTDAERAKEFVSDMQRYVRSDSMPSFTYVSLPGETGRPARPMPTARSARSSISSLTRRTGARRRSSSCPKVRRTRTITFTRCARTRWSFHRWHGAVTSGTRTSAMASVLKTEEEIFGLPPLTLERSSLLRHGRLSSRRRPHPSRIKHHDRRQL